jgi:hypothetical protein
MFQKPKNWIVVGLQCLIYVSSSLAQTPTVPQKADRSFDVEKPSQPIEGHAVPDLVFRREGGFEAGHLQSLLAFATLFNDQEILDQKLTPSRQAAARMSNDDESATSASGDLPTLKVIGKKDGIPGQRIPREQISLILLDGKQPPAEPPAMPPDEDCVLLDSGEVLTGMVIVMRGAVFVDGKSVPLKQATMIRLKSEGGPEPIPAGEKKDPPPERPLGFWIGEMQFLTIEKGISPDRVVTGKYRLCLKEKLSPYDVPAIMKVYYLDRVWLEYEIEIQTFKQPGSFKYWRPNAYSVSGVTSEEVRQASYVKTGPDYKPINRTESSYFEDGGYDIDGAYWYDKQAAHPILQGFDEDGRRDDLDLTWSDHMNDPSFLGDFHTTSDDRIRHLEDNYSRMRGEISLDKGKTIEGLTYLVAAQWDLYWAPTAPPPPERGEPEKKEDEEEDCEHYRNQAQEYDSNQQNNSKLIQELADEIRETKDRLIDLGWTERKHGVNPLDHWLWKGGDSWVAYMSVRKYAPDFEPPFDWSEAEKASFNKLKRLRHAQNELFRSNYEAQMNEAYYREAAKDCERDKANVTGPESSPTPQRDPEFRKKALGDY